MYIEDQYIQEQFQKNFIEGMTCNLVIYGTGMRTEKLLGNISDERIVGLMDAVRTGELVYGKKVLSYEEVARLSNVCIVIIARNAVIHVIYRRIRSFVKEFGISVFDVNGNRLMDEDVQNRTHECFSLCAEDLAERIKGADVVSFDIFDTLLCRRVMRPVDVFRVIDEKLRVKPKTYLFSAERIQAERELGDRNPTIYDIYRNFQKHTSETDDEINCLIKLEIETEKKVLQSRDSMCRFMKQAITQGKKVILISDMYFTKDILKDLLGEFGIQGYDQIYVSCEYGLSKTEGIFEQVRDKECIRGSWLHIGDNDWADIRIPEKLGIQTYKVYSTVEMLEQSIYASIVEYNNSIEENIAIAYFAAEGFNDPFGRYYPNGKLIIDSAKRLAKLIIAPMVFKYVIWLIQKLEKSSENLVLFPSRDGFLLKQIYDLISRKYVDLDLPVSVYFYTSRRAAQVAAAKTREDICRIAEFDASYPVFERLEKRFEIIGEGEFELNALPDSILKAALERSCMEREAYLEYIESTGFFRKKKVALVDLVAIGTVHEALQRITEKKIKGYYFLRRSPDTLLTQELDCESLYGMFGDFQMKFNIYRFYYFLESVITSYEPTFKYVDGEGGLSFYEEYRSSETIELLKSMHDSVYEYCLERLEIDSNVLRMNENVQLYDDLLGFFSADYSEITEDLLEKMANVDEFMGKKVTDMNR